MHLAAAVGTPVVAIFSSRNKPGEWYPFGENNTALYNKTECFGCNKVECIDRGKECIRGITIEMVLNAIGRYISHEGTLNCPEFSRQIAVSRDAAVRTQSLMESAE